MPKTSSFSPAPPLLCTPAAPTIFSFLSAIRLDTHVPLRFTATLGDATRTGQGLLPPLQALRPSASSVTIDDLRNWYNAADKLGKPENYKKRIVEVANGFKAGEQLSAQALTVMNQDTFELEAISRLSQIAQRIGMVLGKSDENITQFLGKIYGITFNTQQRDLTILQKNGEIILNLQSGRVQTNKLTPQILQTFEDANTQIDRILTKSQTQQIDIQR
ncbi:hypothetical protein COO91_09209 (plasmid) [Nostoc flagelliforme CCNUN1]|uniref:Uncharacterized protein n=1 Tax=Nostoc flagelliforme CCNUN1 TaxID=2038116 RepID=A0A2K8T644_9NOSO|nr:hypothetical protein COO91_09209 [Nostoc flagelliforme CCNUN1]